ncbi:MAG TPA: D-hexose-6-phosphate mutarotase [Cellvibrionaceae bacterium]|nr:D-hexose-6-phosphate mutarotase [Cellvibrionaceae bacterium]
MPSTPLTLQPGKDNQPFVCLSHPNGDSCEIYLQGAHVTSWHCQGAEQLFLSRQADFGPGKAIRGGVPVIFPQFGAFGPGAKHGFARNLPWQLDTAASSASCAHFTLAANEQTRKAWPFEFTASYTVELAPDSLLMQLEITNGAAEPMEFTSALHTYFASPDYRQGTLTGLAGLTYWDNGTPWQERQTQNTDALQIADALDRVYFQAHRPLTWQDQARRLEITAEGFADAVVWNPGITGAKALSDMADEEYVQMLCVEAANVAVPIRLEPGAIWRGSQRIQFIG